MQQQLCQEVPHFVISLKNKTFWLTGGFIRDSALGGREAVHKTAGKGLS